MIYLGYAFTIVYSIALIGIILSAIFARKQIISTFNGKIDKKTLLFAIVAVLFFIIFSLLFVHPTEQLYFDENIYQGIAINILHHGNAIWCQYGTGYLQQCVSNAIYHDAVEWPFYLAIAFGIFGISTTTAYALQLFMGCAAIFLIFILSSILLDKKSAVAATIAFSLFPEIFIWSRTSASPDFSFMTFSLFTFIAFVIATKKRNIFTFSLFIFSLVASVYMRIEGILLIPLFIIVGLFYSENSLKRTLSERIKGILKAIETDTKELLFVLALIILIAPQIYYLAMQAHSADYGQGGSQSLFSVQNFMTNSGPNALFFLGYYNKVSYYPVAFPMFTTLAAVAGLAFLFLNNKRKNRFGIAIMLLIWFIAFNLFYDFFYAGAATYGVDVRFMLQLHPAIAILAGIAISGISDIAANAKRVLNRQAKLCVLCERIAFVIAIVVLFVLPFSWMLKSITISPQNMPQQVVVYPAISFFYNNYNTVSNKCLVFTFTPDIWYEQNISAAQIGDLNSQNQTFLSFEKQFPCYVLDYGYWCVVAPYHDSTCSADVSNYNATLIYPPNAPFKGYNVSFYNLTSYRS